MLVLDRIEFQMFFTALCILRLIQLKTKGQTVYTALFSPESSAELSIIISLLSHLFLTFSFALLFETEVRKLLLPNGYPVGDVSYNLKDVLKRKQSKPTHDLTICDLVIVFTIKKKTILEILFTLFCKHSKAFAWI